MMSVYICMIIFDNDCFSNFSYILKFVNFLSGLIMDHYIVFVFIFTFTFTVSFGCTLLTLATFICQIYMEIYTVIIILLR